MIVGVDLDNTIVCYDELFYGAALERGWIPPAVEVAKQAVRDHLRGLGEESRWTELQGYVYGAGMPRARPFPGVNRFFLRCRGEGIPVFVISHRTRYPHLGDRCDLHQAARQWLAAAGFHQPDGIGLPEERVFLEETREEKLCRIREVGCSHFIDDLPEFLAEPGFPERLRKILFDPNGLWPECPIAERAGSWQAVERLVLADAS
jgi:hypothetical protein